MSEFWDATEFKALLREAIGDRKQKQFAEEASINEASLSRMLNDATIAKPRMYTLKKIASASQSEKVTIRNLARSCGYSTDNINDPSAGEEDPFNEAYSFAVKLVNEIKSRVSSVRKYPSLDQIFSEIKSSKMFDTVLNIKISNETKYWDTKCFRNGAEYYCDCSITWYHHGRDNVLYFILFFCKTERGGYIPVDWAFDLETLSKYAHEEVLKYIYSVSETGDINYEDYPICFSSKSIDPKVVEKLLKYIFGDEK